MGIKINAAKASLHKDPALPIDDESVEEEVATHFRGEYLLTGLFTMANDSSSEEN